MKTTIIDMNNKGNRTFYEILFRFFIHYATTLFIDKEFGPETANLALLLIKIMNYGIVQSLLYK